MFPHRWCHPDLSLQVTFQNATSGEYSFYMVSFETLPAGPLSTLELVATVREKVWASVTVENPLSKATCLTMECKCPEISAPSHHTVPGKSKVGISPPVPLFFTHVRVISEVL